MTICISSKQAESRWRFLKRYYLLPVTVLFVALSLTISLGCAAKARPIPEIPKTEQEREELQPLKVARYTIDVLGFTLEELEESGESVNVNNALATIKEIRLLTECVDEEWKEFLELRNKAVRIRSEVRERNRSSNFINYNIAIYYPTVPIDNNPKITYKRIRSNCEQFTHNIIERGSVTSEFPDQLAQWKREINDARSGIRELITSVEKIINDYNSREGVYSSWIEHGGLLLDSEPLGAVVYLVPLYRWDLHQNPLEDSNFLDIYRIANTPTIYTCNRAFVYMIVFEYRGTRVKRTLDFRPPRNHIMESIYDQQ